MSTPREDRFNWKEGDFEIITGKEARSTPTPLDEIPTLPNAEEDKKEGEKDEAAGQN